MQLRALITIAATLTLVTACEDDSGNDNDMGGGLDGSGDGGDGADDGGDDGTDDGADDGSSGDGSDDGGDDGSGDDGETTEPADPDSDGDGLPDSEEEELGTDPNKKDTDEDSYWDPWEINEGTDPLNYDSRIYTGFWPYNPNKDDLHQGTWGESGKSKGDPFPRISLIDQHGESLDFYDLSQFGKNESEGHPGAWIIIDISAMWCGPCNNIAQWLAYNSGPEAATLNAEFPTIRDKVHSGTFLWVTTLYEDSNSQQADAADVAAWANQYDDPWIPVLVDDGKQIAMRYGSEYIPFFFLVHPEMFTEYWNEDGFATLAAIEEHWPG
jgi:hypothetical protein